MKTQTRTLRLFWQVSFVLLAIAGAFVANAADEPEERLSTTSQGQGIERGTRGSGAVSHDEFKPLVVTGKRAASRALAGQQKLSQSGAQAVASLDFWIYDADVQLYSDLDRDGYFSGVDLLFDADTNFAVADVYAVLYLSYELGPWNEYAETANFTIFGASSSDEYVVDTELVSGYPRGSYDILIELFDAHDDTFLTSFGPDESSELAILPLEDVGRDTPPGTTIVVNQGGGGSISWILLLGLLLLAARQRQAAIRQA